MESTNNENKKSRRKTTQKKSTPPVNTRNTPEENARLQEQEKIVKDFFPVSRILPQVVCCDEYGDKLFVRMEHFQHLALLSCNYLPFPFRSQKIMYIADQTKQVIPMSLYNHLCYPRLMIPPTLLLLMFGEYELTDIEKFPALQKEIKDRAQETAFKEWTKQFMREKHSIISYSDEKFTRLDRIVDSTYVLRIYYMVLNILDRIVSDPEFQSKNPSVDESEFIKSNTQRRDKFSECIISTYLDALRNNNKILRDWLEILHTSSLKNSIKSETPENKQDMMDTDESKPDSSSTSTDNGQEEPVKYNDHPKRIRDILTELDENPRPLRNDEINMMFTLKEHEVIRRAETNYLASLIHFLETELILAFNRLSLTVLKISEEITTIIGFCGITSVPFSDKISNPQKDYILRPMMIPFDDPLSNLLNIQEKSFVLLQKSYSNFIEGRKNLFSTPPIMKDIDFINNQNNITTYPDMECYVRLIESFYLYETQVYKVSITEQNKEK